MSHLARELSRQLLWIEMQAKDLERAVEDLVSAGDALMNRPEGWDEEEAETLRKAIIDWGDNCGRSLSYAATEVHEFRRALPGGAG